MNTQHAHALESQGNGKQPDHQQRHESEACGDADAGGLQRPRGSGRAEPSLWGRGAWGDASATQCGRRTCTVGRLVGVQRLSGVHLGLAAFSAGNSTQVHTENEDLGPSTRLTLKSRAHLGVCGQHAHLHPNKVRVAARPLCSLKFE